ncbi:epoxyqueuosine reductase [Eubacterium limosum]|uniref:4Fe-4S double cluster binding domain-containing protein n=1 Tax=Eubacterium limosum TaxID=1736 RepID=A0ABT5UJ99_EUBLI|nr:4Fe-4S double cluster binding domain-containing protein [Eubacterium limosum]MCB6568637.1 epoxyqueuosine reductase [Eubacterium limosum]MDE1468978.1 4Fe-4S double cluster binding domain-containing protein [Eubacterium limosum]
MNPLNEKIEALGKGLGAAQVGFADLSSLPDGLNQGYPAAVSIVVRLSKGILAQIEDAPTATYFSHYRIVNRLIDEITLRVALALEEGGAMAVAVPASQSLPSLKGENPYRGLFAHKTAAVIAGMGWIGKSALFIHRDYGPAVRLGTVLTDAPLDTVAALAESECGSCQACVKACPSMSIEGTLWETGMERSYLLDAHSCSEYMKEAYQHIGRGSVCGLCMVSCPHFRKNL